MSWAEIKKGVNSDCINEPLNYNNYINDIGTFGAHSYVLDTENSALWRDMIKSSLTLYGHDSIHSTVLNRFTDADVDVMIEQNGRLGQSFNSFYSTTVFTSGNINTVLKNLTSNAYNKLDQKFQRGINRYVSKNTTSNVGEWLASVFDISMVKYATMDELLADTNFWNTTVLKNESLRFVICLSVSSATYIASHTSSSIYTSFITTVAQSTDATITLINALAGTNQLTTFFNNSTVCTTLANSKPAMTAICYNVAGFAAMIASSVAMPIVAKNDTAANVIVEALTLVGTAESKLTTIKGSLTTIGNNITAIPQNTDALSEISNAKTAVTTAVSAIQKVTGQADILAANVNKLLSNDSAMKVIAGSSLMLYKICCSPTAQDKVRNNSILHKYWSTIYDTLAGDTTRWTQLAGCSNSGAPYLYLVAGTTSCKQVNEEGESVFCSTTPPSDNHYKYWGIGEIYANNYGMDVYYSPTAKESLRDAKYTDTKRVFVGYAAAKLSSSSGNMYIRFGREAANGVEKIGLFKAK